MDNGIGDEEASPSPTTGGTTCELGQQQESNCKSSTTESQNDRDDSEVPMLLGQQAGDDNDEDTPMSQRQQQMRRRRTMMMVDNVDTAADTLVRTPEDVADESFEQPFVSVLNIIVDHRMRKPTPLEPEEFEEAKSNKSIRVPVMRVFGPAVRGRTPNIPSDQDRKKQSDLPSSSSSSTPPSRKPKKSRQSNSPHQSCCLFIHGAFPYMVARPVAAGPDGSSKRARAATGHVDWDSIESVQSIADSMKHNLEATIQASMEPLIQPNHPNAGRGNADNDKHGTNKGSSALPKRIRVIRSVTVVSGRGFYTYCPGPPAPFLRVEYYDPKLRWKVKLMLERGLDLPVYFHPDPQQYQTTLTPVAHDNGRCPLRFNCYEAHIPYTMQFFKDMNLAGMSYIHLSGGKFRGPLPRTFRKRTLSIGRGGVAPSPQALFLESNTDGEHLWSSFGGPSKPYLSSAPSSPTKLLSLSPPTSPQKDRAKNSCFRSWEKKESSCDIEIDATVAQIMNVSSIMTVIPSQQKEEVHWRAVPSLREIWRQERKRMSRLLQPKYDFLSVPTHRQPVQQLQQPLAMTLNVKKGASKSGTELAVEGMRQLLRVSYGLEEDYLRSIRQIVQRYDAAIQRVDDKVVARSAGKGVEVEDKTGSQSASQRSEETEFGQFIQSQNSDTAILRTLGGLGDQFGDEDGDSGDGPIGSSVFTSSQGVSNHSSMDGDPDIWQDAKEFSQRIDRGESVATIIRPSHTGQAKGGKGAKGTDRNDRDGMYALVQYTDEDIDPATLVPYDDTDDIEHIHGGPEDTMDEKEFVRDLHVLASQSVQATIDADGDGLSGAGVNDLVDSGPMVAPIHQDTVAHEVKKANNDQNNNNNDTNTNESGSDGPAAGLCFQPSVSSPSGSERDVNDTRDRNGGQTDKLNNTTNTGATGVPLAAMEWATQASNTDAQQQSSIPHWTGVSNRPSIVASNTETPASRRSPSDRDSRSSLPIIPPSRQEVRDNKDCYLLPSISKVPPSWLTHTTHYNKLRFAPETNNWSKTMTDVGFPLTLVRLPPRRATVSRWSKKLPSNTKRSNGPRNGQGSTDGHGVSLDGLEIDGNTRKFIGTARRDRKRTFVAFAAGSASAAGVIGTDLDYDLQGTPVSTRSQSQSQSQSQSKTKLDVGATRRTPLDHAVDGSQHNIEEESDKDRAAKKYEGGVLLAKIDPKKPSPKRFRFGSEDKQTTVPNAQKSQSQVPFLGQPSQQSEKALRSPYRRRNDSKRSQNGGALDGIGQIGGRLYVQGGGGLKATTRGKKHQNGMPSSSSSTLPPSLSQESSTARPEKVGLAALELTTPLSILSVEIHCQCRTGKAGVNDSRDIAMRPNTDKDRVVAIVYVHAQDPGGGESIQILERGCLFVPVDTELNGSGNLPTLAATIRRALPRKTMGIESPIHVEAIRDERHLLLRIASIVRWKDPDLLVSWDTQGAGLGYLIERGSVVRATNDGNSGGNTTVDRNTSRSGSARYGSVDMVRLLGRNPTVFDDDDDDHDHDDDGSNDDGERNKNDKGGLNIRHKADNKSNTGNAPKGNKGRANKDNNIGGASTSLGGPKAGKGIGSDGSAQWKGSGLGSDWDERVGPGAAAASIVSVLVYVQVYDWRRTGFNTCDRLSWRVLHSFDSLGQSSHGSCFGIATLVSLPLSIPS